MAPASQSLFQLSWVVGSGLAPCLLEGPQNKWATGSHICHSHDRAGVPQGR